MQVYSYRTVSGRANLELVVLLAVGIRVGDNGLDNISRLSDLAGNLLGNALGGRLDSLAGSRGGLDNDLLGLGNTVNADELSLEN